jgi:hypothetical protein
VIRRLGKFGWGLVLIGFGGFLVVDIWEALGCPGRRCPACRQRYTTGPHRCARVDLDLDDPTEGH